MLSASAREPRREDILSLLTRSSTLTCSRPLLLITSAHRRRVQANQSQSDGPYCGVSSESCCVADSKEICQEPPLQYSFNSSRQPRSTSFFRINSLSLRKKDPQKGCQHTCIQPMRHQKTRFQTGVGFRWRLHDIIKRNETERCLSPIYRSFSPDSSNF